MISPISIVRARLKTGCVLGAVVVVLIVAPTTGDAQVVQGVQQGAQAGNRAAGPVGGVLGGAIGGVVGVFTGVLGVGRNAPPDAASSTQQAAPAKAAKTAKGTKATKQAVLTQEGAPQLTAE